MCDEVDTRDEELSAKHQAVDAINPDKRIDRSEGLPSQNNPYTMGY
jgi:hypothetical protein